MIIEKYEHNKTSYCDSGALLVDIETTGLSPASNHIYCIGCGYVINESIQIELIFAESRKDEVNVLQAFYDLLNGFDKIITFNGATFDLPFIEKRTIHHAGKLKINNTLADHEHIDLYKECRKLKCMLNLCSLKQKSIESFLGISRDDEMTGGELIAVYHAFEKEYKKHPISETRSKELELLLLHNHDDVLGMFPLLGMLDYKQITCREYSLKDFSISTDDDAINALKDTLEITDDHYRMVKASLTATFSLHHAIPSGFIYKNDFFMLAVDNSSFTLNIPVYYGKLKQYFPDHKNYYRLVNEGTLVHKSIGEYLDPSLREKVKKEDCFVSGYFNFITLSRSKDSEEFNRYKTEFKDKNAYMDIPDINGIDAALFEKFIKTNMSF